MIRVTNGEAGGELFNQLIHYGALMKLIAGMQDYLNRLTQRLVINGAVAEEDVKVLYPMTQALALLSKGNLSVQEITALRSFALQLLQEHCSSLTAPETRFLSAGIMGHAAAALSNTITPLITAYPPNAQLVSNVLTDILTFRDAAMNGRGLLDYAREFFNHLNDHRNSAAAAQITHLLRLLLQGQVVLRQNDPTVKLQQPDLTDTVNSPLHGVLASIQSDGGVLSSNMRNDIVYICTQLHAHYFVAQESVVNVVVPARNRIFHFVITVLGLALLLMSFYYLVPLYILCDRGISITFYPLRASSSWSYGNNSFMSWSCVDGGGCTSEEEGDSLKQHIQNLITLMAARNSSCEMTIDSLKAELKSQIEESQKNNSVLLEDCERNLANIQREKALKIASLDSTITSFLQGSFISNNKKMDPIMGREHLAIQETTTTAPSG